MKINSRTAFAVLSLTLFLGCRLAGGQNGGQGSQQLTPQNAANSWRFVGIDPAKQTDTADPETRQARTVFWANALAVFASNTGVAPAISGSAYTISGPEFYNIPGELWVTGTFLSYQAFRLSSAHLAYTEIQFLVRSVISTNPPTGLAPGKVITIGLPGGTLLDDRKPTSYFLIPQQYSLQPGHVYLIQLFHQDTGDLYTPGRDWDITNGTVVPSSAVDVERHKLGTSQIDGTPSSQIVQRMKAILAAQ